MYNKLTKLKHDTLSEKLFYGMLSFIWLEYLWELYLTIRQRRVYQVSTEVPDELKGVLDASAHTRARLYCLDKITFKIVKDLYELCLTTAIFTFGMYLRYWQYSDAILLHFGYKTNSEIVRSLVFYLIMDVTNTILTLPLSIYYTFVLEQSHGFNHQTAGFYVKETIKFFAVSQLMMLPLVVGAIRVMRVGGNAFFVFLWLAVFLLSMFLHAFYPVWIAPLFETLVPLPEGELNARIRKTAARLEFPLRAIYVAEGSTRPSHSSVYFFGLFNKRIVLFDSLLENYAASGSDGKSKGGCDNEEVLAVLMHKFGHWKNSHALKSFIGAQINMTLVFLVFGFTLKYPPIYRSFGFHDSQPVLVGLLIVSYFIVTPCHVLSAALATLVKRRFEFQADAFAKSQGQARQLRTAVVKMHDPSGQFPVNDWLYSVWHLAHPPLLERLNSLDKTE